jgi:hypothetical protein
MPEANAPRASSVGPSRQRTRDAGSLSTCLKVVVEYLNPNAFSRLNSLAPLALWVSCSGHAHASSGPKRRALIYLCLLRTHIAVIGLPAAGADYLVAKRPAV